MNIGPMRCPDCGGIAVDFSGPDEGPQRQICIKGHRWHVAMEKKPSVSPELSAMKVCSEALEPLTDDEVQRALTWLADYFEARRGRNLRTRGRQTPGPLSSIEGPP